MIITEKRMEKIPREKKEIAKQSIRPLFFTILPFLIPFIIYVPDEIINDTGKIIIAILLILIDVYFVLLFSKEDAISLCKTKEIVSINKKYDMTQKMWNRLANCEKIKGEFIKDETYHIRYDYTKNILLYNPHKYLERVCDENSYFRVNRYRA